MLPISILLLYRELLFNIGLLVRRYIHGKIFDNEVFWKIMYFLWVITVILIIYNSLSNSIFAIILGGLNIYIMLT